MKCAIHDCGCAKSECCFTCPLPACVYEPSRTAEPRFTARILALAPAVLAATAAGKSQNAIAKEFGISDESVRRLTR